MMMPIQGFQLGVMLGTTLLLMEVVQRMGISVSSIQFVESVLGW